ncbi:uncharacterized protein LOC115089819 [Rhinatrema bivittatum]|uniref:uncharacterized protein LOC115089819 n=1 Tax=Rhinatrema bivittatum TaxID=194408 RepID=UPI00112BB2F4|nr:uncharacterized protein LOC115089819 [Rhinatrema bivittatum]
MGPETATEAKNLLSARNNEEVIALKIKKESDMGRVEGPFKDKPLPHFRISPLGVVPKKEPGEFRMIHHLSFPEGGSVNDYLDPEACSVAYASFDQALDMVRHWGQGAWLAKADIESAFRLLPIHPSCFHLLGFQFRGKYYFDKCLPMGCSISCAYFERFSTFVQWAVEQDIGKGKIIHYLDDFLFTGHRDTQACAQALEAFTRKTDELGIPLAKHKSEGPSQKLSFLGHLNFACKIMPMGRPFMRRLSQATAGIRRSHHFIRITKELREDLIVWKTFLGEYNGRTVWRDPIMTNRELQLYTDAAGSAGFGAYLAGKWCTERWPVQWEAMGLLRDITFLELFPIVAAIHMWKACFHNRRVVFWSDNMAVVQAINSLTAHSPRVIRLLRDLVLLCLRINLVFKAKYVPGEANGIADALSRCQWSRFRFLAPEAEHHPYHVPPRIWELGCPESPPY